MQTQKQVCEDYCFHFFERQVNATLDFTVILKKKKLITTDIYEFIKIFSARGFSSNIGQIADKCKSQDKK